MWDATGRLLDATSSPLILTFVGAALASFVVSIVVKCFYTKAVKREMSAGRKSEGARDEKSSEPNQRKLSPPELRIELFDARAPFNPSPRAEEMYRAAKRARLSAALIYAVAGSAYAVAAVLIVVFVVRPTRPEPASGLRYALALLVVFLWPVVWTVWNVAGVEWPRRLLWGALHVLVLVAVSVGFWPEAASLWALYVGFPTVARWVLANRKLKAVGTTSLVFIFLLGLGFVATRFSEHWLSRLSAAWLPERWGCGGECLTLIAAPGVLTFSLFLASAVVIWMGLRHNAKLASDQSVVIDTHWLLLAEWMALASFLICDVEAIGRAASFPLSAIHFPVELRTVLFSLSAIHFPVKLCVALFLLALFLLALALNWVITYACFRHQRRAWRRRCVPQTGQRNAPPEGCNVRLLLLRIFGKQSEGLIDGLGVRWRYAGSIQLITGTDLAAATLEVHELIDFVTGRLRDHYIKSDEDLTRQFKALDLKPDLDGRFRVNEFFCDDFMWRETVLQLFGESDAVLTDLRGFRDMPHSGGGVTYEIEQLFNLVPLDKLLILFDGTTEEKHLHKVLQEAWQKMHEGSENCKPDAGALRMLRVGRLGPRELRRLVALLFEQKLRPAEVAGAGLPIIKEKQ